MQIFHLKRNSLVTFQNIPHMYMVKCLVGPSYVIITKNKTHECRLCTKISKVRSLHVARLFLEDGGATAGKGVHVGRDGVDGHMAGPGSFLDGMVVPQSK